MSGQYLAFFVLALIALGGGVFMLNLNKVVHMVVALVFTFVSIAGIYVLLSAEFVAAVQVLIYSGAITIIMLFGIMLTRHQDDGQSTGSPLRKALALLGTVAFGAVMYIGIRTLDFGSEAVGLHDKNTEQIGIALYSKYVIPFELASVLLLVALIGAVILAKKMIRRRENECAVIRLSRICAFIVLHRIVRSVNETQYSHCAYLYRTHVKCRKRQLSCI